MRDSGNPSLDEVVAGAFLEDIGKFMQRAHDGLETMPLEVRNRASILLPSWQGRSSHWHVLWTEAFFAELERRGVPLPGGMNRDRVRDAAVFHHRPDTALHWLSAEADRLSAGMDRKQRDEDEERERSSSAGFRGVALRSIFSGVDLGLAGRKAAPVLSHRVAELGPGMLEPGKVDPAAQVAAYRGLWPAFMEGFVELCSTAKDAAMFHEGLLSLSERFTWAIPSSTMDQPDVPLHDHDKTVAAIAACLYLHHAERGELGDVERIKDRDRPKFRFVVGDLSGIQSTLFRLAAQQVKGSARILRARSFLMGAVVEAASLLARRALGLPAYCELQAAGGRFVLLAPVVEGMEAKLEAVRAGIDQWICERYLGDLALNLVAGPQLAGRDLMKDRFRDAWATVSHAAEEAKLHALASVAQGVLAHDFGADGPCDACGVRAATRRSSEAMRCVACHDEYEVGRHLPDARVVLWADEPLPSKLHAHQVAMPGGLFLCVLDQPLRLDDEAAWRRVVSGWRVARADSGDAPPARRSIANHVPRLSREDLADSRFAGIDMEHLGEGHAKTFEHLARLAADPKTRKGRQMLAVLKADIDMLGQVFSRGLGQDQSLGRVATLSRMVDAFFTVVLPDLLAREFPDTYTVYAGGDDLLLLGPWLQMIRLSARLAEAFQRHVGGNESITISAGIEFCGVAEPLNRAVRRAEARLEAAKDAGRRRVSLVDADPMLWAELPRAIEDADRIHALVAADNVTAAFVYKCLDFARARRRAEGGKDGKLSLHDADWRARWAYHLKRAFADRRSAELGFFDTLLGSGLASATGRSRSTAETSLVIAIYRNR